jgi:hypothetical protein
MNTPDISNRNRVPLFHPGQQAVVVLGNATVPCRVFGVEPGENARGFHGVPWVYHVIPEGSDFGVNVPETAVRPAMQHSYQGGGS